MISEWFKVNVKMASRSRLVFRLFSNSVGGKKFQPIKGQSSGIFSQSISKTQEKARNINDVSNLQKDNSTNSRIAMSQESETSKYVRRHIDILKRQPLEYRFRDLFKVLLDQKVWNEPYRSLFDELTELCMKQKRCFSTLFVISEIVARCKRRDVHVPLGFYQLLLIRALEIASNFTSYREHIKSIATISQFLSKSDPQMFDRLISDSKVYLVEHAKSLLVDQQAVIVHLLASKATINNDEIKICEALVNNIAELSDICDLAELSLLIKTLLSLQSRSNQATKGLEASSKLACKKIIERLQKRPLSSETFNPLDFCDLVSLKEKEKMHEEFSQLNSTLAGLKVPAEGQVSLLSDSMINHWTAVQDFLGSDLGVDVRQQVTAMLDKACHDAYLRNYKQPVLILKTIAFRKLVLGLDTHWSESQFADFRDMLRAQTHREPKTDLWKEVLEKLKAVPLQFQDSKETRPVSGLIRLDHPLLAIRLEG
jgi:hypothetical protein